MSFSISKKDNYAIIAFDGDIMGGAVASQLNETIHELINSDYKNIIINLDKVNFMNSLGLGMLVGALTTVRKVGGKLMITNTTEKISELLAVTKLNTVLSIYNSIDEAVNSIG